LAPEAGLYKLILIDIKEFYLIGLKRIMARDNNTIELILKRSL